jgi:hypothetical protein
MPGSIETTAAVLARLFKGSNATLGSNWVDSVNVSLSDTCLHHLVVSNGTLSAAKTRDMYGHFHIKTQMKHTPGRYWKEAPIPALKQDAIDLNDMTLDSTSRLNLLRTGSFGGLLVVTQLFDETGAATEAFMTILAAPSVVTYRQEPADQGIILDDICEESAINGFDPALVTLAAHCPILAAQEGYSRDPSLLPKVETLLLDSHPLLLPEGELTSTTVQHGDTIFLRSFFFPEVCNLPLGLCWPTNIGYKEFIAIIRVTLGKNSLPFEVVLEALQPTLEPWFNAVTIDHQLFPITGRQFLPLYDKHFPDILSGVWPVSTPDLEAFSPVLEMLNGFIWRLWCNRVLSTATVLNRNYLSSYLAIG